MKCVCDGREKADLMFCCPFGHWGMWTMGVEGGGSGVTDM